MLGVQKPFGARLEGLSEGRTAAGARHPLGQPEAQGWEEEEVRGRSRSPGARRVLRRRLQRLGKGSKGSRQGSETREATLREVLVQPRRLHERVLQGAPCCAPSLNTARGTFVATRETVQ